MQSINNIFRTEVAVMNLQSTQEVYNSKNFGKFLIIVTTHEGRANIRISPHVLNMAFEEG